MKIWIVRKHPVIRGFRGGVLKAFTIHKTYATRQEAAAEVKKKDSKSMSYKYMVGCVELKEEQGTQCKPNK